MSKQFRPVRQQTFHFEDDRTKPLTAFINANDEVVFSLEETCALLELDPEEARDALSESEIALVTDEDILN